MNNGPGIVRREALRVRRVQELPRRLPHKRHLIEHSLELRRVFVRVDVDELFVRPRLVEVERRHRLRAALRRANEYKCKERERRSAAKGEETCARTRGVARGGKRRCVRRKRKRTLVPATDRRVRARRAQQGRASSAARAHTTHLLLAKDEVDPLVEVRRDMLALERLAVQANKLVRGAVGPRRKLDFAHRLRCALARAKLVPVHARARERTRYGE